MDILQGEARVCGSFTRKNRIQREIKTCESSRQDPIEIAEQCMWRQLEVILDDLATERMVERRPYLPISFGFRINGPGQIFICCG
jgi:hypothetical protein